MDAATHYPPSLLPWQALSYSDPDFTREWFCTLADWRDERPICELRVTLRPYSKLWTWRIITYGGAGVIYPPLRYYGGYRLCELSMLTALAAYLHTPPSGLLPPREGATKPGKERGNA